MAKIAVIGICGNSIFMSVDHFHEKGETLVAHSVYEEIGGKGFNQAVTCARMGAEVSFLAAIGDDNDGRQCIRVAKENGINGYFVTKSDCKTTFAVILTDKNGENQVTGYRSAELCVDDVTAFEGEIAAADILLLQNEVPQSVNEAAVSVAQKHGVKVLLNPAPIRDIPNDMAAAVFLVTPNEQEKKAIDVSRFRNVITTLGGQGCCINEQTYIDALKVKAVDTTGAGDVFNGTLAVYLAENCDWQTACRYAVAASGISVTKRCVLASIPTKKEVERMMNNE